MEKMGLDQIYYQLVAIDNDKRKHVFKFRSLEDVIYFTENVIDKYNSIEEIIDAYLMNYDENKYNSSSGKIFLTLDEVDQAIIEYFGSGKNYRVSAKEEVKLSNSEMKVNYYLIEHLDYNGVKLDNTILLTKGDIRNALNNYLKLYNYELVDFKYIGDVDKDSVYYDGIEMIVREKGKRLVLS